MDTKDETRKVVSDVSRISEARLDTENTLFNALQVKNFSLSVTVAEIQDLSQRIINTVVNEGEINDIYEGAQVGLLRAQDVCVLSEKAV